MVNAHGPEILSLLNYNRLVFVTPVKMKARDPCPAYLWVHLEKMGFFQSHKNYKFQKIRIWALRNIIVLDFK